MLAVQEAQRTLPERTHTSGAAAVTHHRRSRREEKKYKGCARGVRLFALRTASNNGVPGGRDPPRDRDQSAYGLRQRAANPGHTRRARASAPAVCCSAHSGRAPRKKRSLQQSSLARHWPRDWRALSLARVSGRRPPRAREHMLPGHSMGSGRIHSSVKSRGGRGPRGSTSMDFFFGRQFHGCNSSSGKAKKKSRRGQS